MTDNIVKQNEIYHVELAVPLDVKKYFGKVKFRKTLKTKNYDIAKQVAPSYIKEWKGLIENMRDKNALDKIKENTNLKSDIVNHPPHYKLNSKGIECIDAIEATLTPEEFRGYLRGQVIKYIWRCNYKGKRLEDLEKAEWYLKRYIELLKKEL
jgi:hypothetical protein